MTMLIRLGYDIQFYVPFPLAFVAQLRVHPSRAAELREPDVLHIEHSAGQVDTYEYIDSYGNICTRFFSPSGNLRLWANTVIEDPGQLDLVNRDAKENPPQDLPNEVLCFLLNSRYCEVDLLSAVAHELFGAD